MADSHNSNRRTQRRTKNGTNLSLIIIPAIVLLLIIGGVWYMLFMSSSNTVPPDSNLVEELPVTAPPEPISPEPEISIQQETIPETSDELTTISQLPELPDEISLTQPEEVIAPPPAEKEKITKTPCTIAKENLQEFFTYLDQQHYMGSFELEDSSQAHFLALAQKLLQNPPIVVRESDDLYTMLRNMAHFFRVIGKKNIIIIKTILDKERDQIEDIAANLYTWSVTETCEAPDFPLQVQVSQLYEYAGFFLNTMGGRSYLFRRDSRSRLLVNYYALLIIDQANSQGTNKHGIKIDSIISQLIGEIEASNQLIYKEAYLDKLYELLERYQTEN